MAESHETLQVSEETTATATASGARPGRGRRLLAARPSARTAGLCLLAGVLLAGSLPPWGFWPLAFGGIALLDVLLAGRSRGSRAGRMGLVAFVLFAITLFWIKDLTAPGFVIVAVVFAAMFSVLGVLVPPGRGRHLALPAVWLLAEAWKARWPFGGVPISDLAIGQVGGPLAGLARLGGVPLLSGTTVAVGAIVAALVTGRTLRARLGAARGRGRPRRAARRGVGGAPRPRHRQVRADGRGAGRRQAGHPGRVQRHGPGLRTSPARRRDREAARRRDPLARGRRRPRRGRHRRPRQRARPGPLRACAATSTPR